MHVSFSSAALKTPEHPPLWCAKKSVVIILILVLRTRNRLAMEQVSREADTLFNCWFPETLTCDGFEWFHKFWSPVLAKNYHPNRRATWRTRAAWLSDFDLPPGKITVCTHCPAIVDCSKPLKKRTFHSHLYVFTYFVQKLLQI